MSTRYDNMNTPERRHGSSPEEYSRSRQENDRVPVKSNTPSAPHDRNVRGQIPARRNESARGTRPEIKKSQTLQSAKSQPQPYVPGQYSRQAEYNTRSSSMHSQSPDHRNTYSRQTTAGQRYPVRQDTNSRKNQTLRQNLPPSVHGNGNTNNRHNTGSVKVPRRPSLNQKRRRLIFYGVLALFILSLFFFWMSRYYQPVIVPGVHINDIDMTGKTKEEAIHLLEQQMEELRDSIHVTLKYGDQTWQLTREEFLVEAPIEHTVNLAMQVAREGNVFQRMSDGWDAKREMPHFETAISISDNGMSQRVADIAAQLDVPAIDATMTFNADEADFSIKEGVGGQVLNQTRVKEAVLDALRNDYMVSTIEFGLDDTEPAVKKADLAKATSRISFFETEVNGSQNRIDNVKLALSQFNGMVIAPGQMVSFNETTGERSEQNGYKEAPGINADKGLEDTLGGGVCQASTTLYNAVLQANCSIQERHRHSFPSSYVKEGFDAMVNWASHDDLKFTNTSDMPLFIRTYVGKHGDGKTYAQVWIYGKKLENGITLSRKSVILNEIEKPEPELIKDRDGRYADYVTYDDEAYVAVASRKGMTVEAYLVTKDADGNVIKEELLHTDYFSAITGKHYYGTQKRPDDVPQIPKSGCYIIRTEEEESNSPD